MFGKKGQIWIEVVIYTLIGLSIIGALLYFATPVIQEKQDEILIQQSETLMKTLQNRIEDVLVYGSGNSRTMELTIRSGEFTIDGEKNITKLEIESRHMFSEPGTTIKEGKYSYLTEEKGEEFIVTLQLDYSDYNITWNGQEKREVFQEAARPYNIVVSNKGGRNIDFTR